MTINKKAANKATNPDNTATPVGEIIKSKIGKSVKKPKILNCPKCNRAYKKQDSLDVHIRGCKGGKGGAGGWQGAGGRPKGSENEKTKELKAIKAGMQMRIAGKVNQLLTAQFRMAVGTGRLYVRHVEKVQRGRGKNKWMDERIDVRKVEHDDDFIAYLNLSHDEYGRATDPDTGDQYYYMPAKEGNPIALANMLDRAFGKPKESMEVGEDPDAPLPKHGTGTTTELRKAMIAMVKQQIKDGGKK
jgi:hypothetical protein